MKRRRSLMGTGDEVWLMFMARIAVLAEERPDASVPLDRADIEGRVQSLIEQEGGRPHEWYWLGMSGVLGSEDGALRLITLFETRSQYPIISGDGGTIDLQKYVRPPGIGDEGMPVSLGPDDMALAIRDALNASGKFLVVELEQWYRHSHFSEAIVHQEGPYWAFVIGKERSPNQEG